MLSVKLLAMLFVLATAVSLATGRTFLDYIPPNECILWTEFGVGYNQVPFRTLVNFSQGTEVNHIPVSLQSESLYVSPSDDTLVEDYVYVPYQYELKKTRGVLTRDSYHVFNVNTFNKSLDTSVIVSTAKSVTN